MRPLTEEEAQVFFSKLAKYIGRNIARLIDRPSNPHGFYIHNDKIYYASELVVSLAQNIPRNKLMGIGTCFGKFTRSKRFFLHITALDHMASHAKYRLWLKPNGEMSYLYGNNILKAHMSKMTDQAAEHQGLIVCSHNDLPLGFAITAKSSLGCQNLAPTAIVGLHQTDIGEYLRDENSLV